MSIQFIFEKCYTLANIFLSLMFATLFGINTSLFAQVSFTITEINPSQSTLHPDGASGGRINGLATASDGQTFFAASEWGGLYKSTDAGRTWFRLDGHLPTATWDVAVDPTNSNKVYATSFYDGRVNSLAGINVSNDGGITWIHPPTATPPVGVYTSDNRRNNPSAFGISIDPANPQNVYVGTNAGLAISNDAGSTWRYVDPTPDDKANDIWDVIVHDGSIIDLVGDDGHQRSTDGGNTWTTAITEDLALPATKGYGSIAVSPDESYVLFAIVGGGYIYESDDGGASWSTCIPYPNKGGRIPFVATNQRSGNFFGEKSFDLWFGAVSLYRLICLTPDTRAPGGTRRAPWPLGTPFPNNTLRWNGPYTTNAGAHDDVGDIVFDPAPSVDACPVLFSSDGGVYYNTVNNPDCHFPKWGQPDVTPHGLWVWDMSGADLSGIEEEALYFGTQDNGIFVSTNAGATNPTWLNKDSGDGFDVSANRNWVLYTVCCFPLGRSNRLYLRGPGMSEGGDLGSGNYPPGNIPMSVPTDCIANFGPDDFAVITTKGLFITDDITIARQYPYPFDQVKVKWTQLGAATSPTSTTPNVQLRNVKVSFSSSTPTFYVQFGFGDGRSQDQLWKFVGTEPDGAWQQIMPPGGNGGFGIYDVDHRNNIIASHLQPPDDPRMILSNDGGDNWILLPVLDNRMTRAGIFRYQNQRGPTGYTSFSGYPQPTLVAIDPADPNIIVAGAADAGVFVSNDGGEGWTPVTDPINPVGSGLPQIPRPRSAYFDHGVPGKTNIFIGSQGRGVWKAQITNTRLIVNFKILPFRDPGTSNLLIDGSVKFSDIGFNPETGNTVTRVVNVTPGAHTVSISAGSFTSLSNYVTIISGDCSPDGKFTIASSETKICTFTLLAKSGEPACRATCQAVRDNCIKEGPQSPGECATFYQKCLTELCAQLPQQPELAVDLKLMPPNDPGKFNLQINGVVKANNVGNGGSTGPIDVNVGAHTVGVSAGAGTNLNNYFVNYSDNCSPDGTVLIAGTPIPIPNGYRTTCTLTLSGPQLTIKSAVSPVLDPGVFNLQIDGVTRATNIGHGETTVGLSPGLHTISVAAGIGTNLGNYTTSFGGDCSSNGSVTLEYGDKKTCTITNTAKSPAACFAKCEEDFNQCLTIPHTPINVCIALREQCKSNCLK